MTIELPFDGNSLLKNGIGRGWYIRNERTEAMKVLGGVASPGGRSGDSSVSWISFLDRLAVALLDEEEISSTSPSASFRTHDIVLIWLVSSSSSTGPSSCLKDCHLNAFLFLHRAISVLQCKADNTQINAKTKMLYVKMNFLE